MSISNKSLTKKQKQGKETKMKIFNTAISLFSEIGFNNVTIEDITSKVNISKGNFYTHFESKEDVYIQFLFSLSDNYNKIYHSIQSLSFESTAEKLLFFIEKILSWYFENVDVEKVAVIYNPKLKSEKRDEYMTNENRPLFVCIKNIILEGIEIGEFRNDIDPSYLAEIIITFFRGEELNWCYNKGSYCIVKKILSSISVVLEGFKINHK